MQQYLDRLAELLYEGEEVGDRDIANDAYSYSRFGTAEICTVLCQSGAYTGFCTEEGGGDTFKCNYFFFNLCYAIFSFSCGFKTTECAYLKAGYQNHSILGTIKAYSLTKKREYTIDVWFIPHLLALHRLPFPNLEYTIDI